MTAPVFVALTPGGYKVASTLAKTLSGASVHGLNKRTEGANETFSDTIAHLRYLFISETPIIGVCAAGILIRALAPLISDKRKEPPVLAVSEDGRTVVPLLGGHNGANRLAQVPGHLLHKEPRGAECGGSQAEILQETRWFSPKSPLDRTSAGQILLDM